MAPAASSGAGHPAVRAPLGRRLLALVYEALLLAAVALIGVLPFIVLTTPLDATPKRLLLQLYLIVLVGAYFLWQWCHGGQTLPMKTWRLRLVTRNGSPLTPHHAITRYVYALAGSLLLGAGFVWALVDREGLFLHDRLAGTKIVKSEE